MCDKTKSAFQDMGAEAGETYFHFMLGFSLTFTEALDDLLEKANATEKDAKKAYEQADAAMLKAFEIAYQAKMDLTDVYGCFKDEDAAEDGEPSAPVYTDSCKQCWCNTCGALEDCPRYDRVGDGIEPAPCAVCGREKGSGEQLMPVKDGKPKCYKG